MMTNYLIQQPSTTPIEIMDRKKKKPVMEKQRRDRMNKALEDLKVIIIRHDPNHTSKLEKADILEKTLELMKIFELQLSQFHQQATGHIVHGILEGLVRNKAQPETIKAVQEAVVSMFPLRPQAPPPPPRLPQATVPQPATAMFHSRPLPPNFSGFPMCYPTATLPYPRLPPQAFSTPVPLMTTPKASSAPVMAPTPSKLPDPRVESDTSEDDEDLIDVEKVDDNDETFSPPSTPHKSARPSLKRLRSRSSSSFGSNDDSGISEDGPSPPKKKHASSFSIDGILK